MEESLELIDYTSCLCFHPSFIDKICTWCNKSVIECGDPTTIPFSYIHSDLALSLDEIIRLRDNNLQHLFDRKKLHLVLDLDHTLVHARLTDSLSSYEIESIQTDNDVFALFDGGYVVKLRPGVREFITKVGSLFDLSIYSMGNRAYVQEVHKLLVSEAGFPSCSWVISREDCVEDRKKRLDVVLSHEQVVVIVDDTQEVWEDCNKNLVNIGPYNFFPIKDGAEVDTELDRVYKILKQIHTEYYYVDNNFEGFYGEECDLKDVRDVLKEVMDDELDSEIILYDDQEDADEGSATICNRKRIRDDNTMSIALLHHTCGQPATKRSRTTLDPCSV